ncbi:MAG: outer membrane beta-barrel protein [Xanthobacteraceae bacterium]|nr:outer membrane beta-barrel protein [Xanthobacteraceae bacterium]
MRTHVLTGLLAAFGGIATAASAADLKKAPQDCKAYDAPYKNYDCLDAYLGDGFFGRLISYYRLEWGHDAAPADPKAPPGRRDGWPATPLSVPPCPFTEWPYGAATALGVTRPSANDSPLMVALANTALGKAMNDSHIQMYGWVNGGGNISTSTVKPGGNAPAADMYTPNTMTLDQAVVYIERLPDTVQSDHVDWGFRVSGTYGENDRYTTTYGIASNQLLGRNLTNIYDFPMVYGEVFVPQIGEGLLLRAGRYIGIPDIEAQLAPNIYMYSHSMTYAYDNYTNEGLIGTLALTKNWFVQLGVTIGTDTAAWLWGRTVPNPFPNPVYPNSTMPKDPGAVPSLTAAVRWQSNSGNDSFYLVANGINGGQWGYNNLQWLGGTYYHKFDEHWHLAFEMYTLSQRNVLNQNNPEAQTIIANGGYPFTAANGFNYNAPNFAQCNAALVSCTARVVATVAYLNYKVSALDNISLRPEFYDDMAGQRTGVKTRYANIGIGWQHWFSPQLEIRPEVVYDHSLDANAFNGNAGACPTFGACKVIAPDRNFAWIASMDMILHF